MRLSSAALLALSLLLLSPTFAHASPPSPGAYLVERNDRAGVASCALRGPDEAPLQFGVVQRLDDRIFLRLNGSGWRLGPDSHGAVTLTTGRATTSKEFRRASAMSMTAELDWFNDSAFITSIVGAPAIDIAFPNGNAAHLPAPTTENVAAFEQCTLEQQSQAAATVDPLAPQRPATGEATPSFVAIDDYRIGYYPRFADIEPHCVIWGPRSGPAHVMLIMTMSRTLFLRVHDDTFNPDTGTWRVEISVGPATLVKPFERVSLGDLETQLTAAEQDGDLMRRFFDGTPIQIRVIGTGHQIAGPTAKVRDASETCFRKLH